MKHYIPLFVILLTVSSAAQQPAPAKPPAAPPAPAAPPPPRFINPEADPSKGQRVNIRMDVSVSDGSDTIANQPKTLMVMLSDRGTGRTRGAFEDRTISVDATPIIVDGRIRVTLTIESRFFMRPGKEPDPTLAWQNSFSLLLESGKPMLAFETSDPVTKRKLAIEVKATIQK